MHFIASLTTVLVIKRMLDMYKNILVPVDVYETLADKALQHAQFLAQSASGDIHLLHVMPKFSAELTRGFISDARKMDEYMINNSKEKLSDLVKNSICQKNVFTSMFVAEMFVMRLLSWRMNLLPGQLLSALEIPIFKPISWGQRRQVLCVTHMFLFSLFVNCMKAR
jgi:universal stress protein G